jgi:hypothetical protein
MRPLPNCLPIVAAAVLLAALALAPNARADFGIADFRAELTAEGGLPATQAGSHPLALSLTTELNPSAAAGEPLTEGYLRDLSFELPPGLIENPTAVQPCTQADFHSPRNSPWEQSLSGESCPDRAQVGILTLRSSYAGGSTRSFGLFNLAPPPGAPSELGANPYGAPIIFVPSLRQADGEYGITLATRSLTQLTDVSALTLTIWGNPWSILHNSERGNCLNEAEPGFGWAKCSIGRPAKNPATAYLTLPTSCDGPLRFTATATSWSEPGVPTQASETPALNDCGALAFEPTPAAQLSDPRASSPSGYEFDINVDTSGVANPRGRASSPVRKAVVTLPAGVTVNPSVGAGLGVCTPAQYQAETPTSPPGAGCPGESKIGDFSVRTPIVSGTLEEGSIFLAAPYENPFNSLLAVYLVAKSVDRGILVKVAGELRADAATGRLTASFDQLPQLPYSQLRIHFREGQRSPLATPAACGAISTEADLTPWRDAGLVRHASLPASITSGVGGGPCPQGLAPFTPKVAGGTLNSQAGAFSPFYLHLTRTDVEQEITSYSATLPPGLLGRIAGVPYCSDAAIAAAADRSGIEERDHPSCPATSRIGRTTSGYGVGTVLSYAPGGLYLAGPYRGSTLSVVAIDSALVGPFDLGTVVVRSAIRIDPETAQASIDATGTDPIPHIIDGIPIHLRDIRAYIDRPGFTLNPTSCAASSISSALNGAGARFADPSDDSLAFASGRFQAFNCSSLGFRPRISIKLKGGTARSKQPALTVVVRPRPGDANIASAQVTLPDTLFLNQAHIRGICTRVQFNAERCPPDSVYGRVRAYTPLLAEPLQGNAYLRSSNNTLPDLVFALRGQGIAINVAGKIDSVKGGIRGTFPTIPDASVSRFELKLGSGKQGILENAGNLCAGPQLGLARFMGHANRGWILKPAVQARCAKRHHPRKSHQRRRGR